MKRNMLKSLNEDLFKKFENNNFVQSITITGGKKGDASSETVPVSGTICDKYTNDDHTEIQEVDCPA